MMDARLAHLAIVDASWTTGHNVVVDGYNTDEYYHLNFGWGGAYNGWYLLPDEIPYGLTVIEGLITNIAYPPIHTNINCTLYENQDLSLNIYPNPVTDHLTAEFTTEKAKEIKIEIYNILGRLLISIPVKPDDGSALTELLIIPDIISQKPAKGFYLCKLYSGEKVVTKRFIIQ